jgi:hypothetical protein
VKLWYLPTSLHGITTQKINTDIFTTVRTSNIICVYIYASVAQVYVSQSSILIFTAQLCYDFFVTIELNQSKNLINVLSSTLVTESEGSTLLILEHAIGHNPESIPSVSSSHNLSP